ncbi:Uncharacterized protein OS=candidate division ZIXI bacterium RBG-1 GN=RBG1_1C00001G1778 PE=4 SV=1: DUF58 [Gemmataceae bacterium]|nr:Uncharacterized protein OS=candidate division ZIXI bacterium RBG-1 GN=RBG1_1C00001G1778 PE=4 SV=1: DUF58 [Gemmataceae bacterium]VTT96425.1 Uncharacterized protein OS=candidate division ZIXI bacterium RBG-1 GN=RBG1_1C00001G1778 PE=4 SV=1: DUF58 [Gemmataceae bacterium]
MLSTDVLRQVRRVHLRARRLVQTLLGGEYHSAFKGAGLSFEEVREYQPGDDVRTIDWNVTARVGQPFIKRFVEERELTMLLVVDVSASTRFGTGSHTKRTVAAELAALLALCATSNNDRIGLVAFTSEVERFVPPNKGPRHVLRVLRDVLAFEPQKPGTDLAAALDYVTKVQRRRAVVFVLSDFLGTGYEKAFRRAARKHDLVAVRTTDPREAAWPAAGLVRVRDAETGEQFVVDTSDAGVRERFARQAAERAAAFTKVARGSQADVVEVGTDGGHFEALLGFFRRRDRRRRRG